MSEPPRLPPRPAIPATLYALAATITLEAVVLRLDRSIWLVSHNASSALCIAAFFILVGLCVLWRRGGIAQLVGLTLVCALAGGVLSLLLCVQGNAFVAQARALPVSHWEVKLVSDCSPSREGWRCRAQALLPGGARGDVWLQLSERHLLGETITCIGRYREPQADEWGRSNWAQGIWGSVSVAKVLSVQPEPGVLGAIHAVRNHTLERFAEEGHEGRAVLAGVLCGERSQLKELGLDELFATCGSSHLVAVSGAHLAILSQMLTSLFMQTKLGVKSRIGLLTLATGAFVIFCGLPISALRAWIMALIAAASQLVGRRAHALSSVSVCALLMALVEPTLSGQLSFLLSVLSVIGLALFSPYAAYALEVLTWRPWEEGRLPYKLRRRLRMWGKELRQLLAATLVCQLVSSPLTLPVFGQLSLVAALANLLVTPLLTALVWAGALAASLQPVQPFCELALMLCDLASGLLLGVLRLCAQIPLASISAEMLGPVAVLLAVLLPLAILLFWPRLTKARVLAPLASAALVAALVLVSWRWFAPARMVVLDIGQGDAILIQDGGSAILVDAGPDDAVLDALGRCHVLHLDAILITHMHDDHFGGILELAGKVSCNTIIVAGGVASNIPYELKGAINTICPQGVEELSYGDVLHVGDFSLRMVWPRAPVDGSENAHSIELALSYDKDNKSMTALLTGDAEQDETAAVLAAEDIASIDVLKVGHHGSAISVNQDIAAKLSPLIAAASAGENNRYGHPSAECKNFLEDAGAYFLCTIDSGDIDIRPGEAGPRII